MKTTGASFGKVEVGAFFMHADIGVWMVKVSTRCARFYLDRGSRSYRFLASDAVTVMA